MDKKAGLNIVKIINNFEIYRITSQLVSQTCIFRILEVEKYGSRWTCLIYVYDVDYIIYSPYF